MPFERMRTLRPPFFLFLAVDFVGAVGLAGGAAAFRFWPAAAPLAAFFCCGFLLAALPSAADLTRGLLGFVGDL